MKGYNTRSCPVAPILPVTLTLGFLFANNLQMVSLLCLRGRDTDISGKIHFNLILIGCSKRLTLLGYSLRSGVITISPKNPEILTFDQVEKFHRESFKACPEFPVGVDKRNFPLGFSSI